MKINYRPEIDGLRSIAVLAVVFFHADFLISFTIGNRSFEDLNLFKGGFIGVDVFFVVSGYLITSLILNGLKKNSFTLANFYERRARRILPALFTIIIVSIPLSFIYLLPKQIEEYSISVLSTLLFISNIWFWIEDGYSYWAPINEFKPLLHTWSLAVEEQFYIFYPIFLIFIFSFFKKYFTELLLVVFLISLSIAQFASENYIVANFYLLPPRGWELIAGALLAKLEFSKKRISHPTLTATMPLLGLVIILNSVFIFDSSTPHPSVLTLYPIIGTMLIIWFSKRGEFVSNILSSKILVFLGKISYSLYLWHFLLFSYAHTYYQQLDNVWTKIELENKIKFLIIFISLILSIITYFLIERPFRSKTKIKTKTFLITIFTFFILLLIFFGYSHKSRGFTDIYLKKNPFYSAYMPIEENTPPKMYNDGNCKYHSKNFNEKVKQKLIECYKKHGNGLIILGDSHAMNLYNLTYSHSKENFIFGLSNGGCRAHDSVGCHYSKFHEFLKNQKLSNNSEFDISLFKIVYVQSGSYLFLDPQKKLKNRGLFRADKVREYDLDYNDISNLEKYIISISKHTEVIWFGSRIEPSIDPKKILKNGCRKNIFLKKNIEKNFLKLDNFIKKISLNKNYKYISQIDAINFNDKNDLFSCSEIFWRDGDHFSVSGIKRFAPRILNKLEIQ